MEPLDFFTDVIVFLVNVLEWDRKTKEKKLEDLLETVPHRI